MKRKKCNMIYQNYRTKCNKFNSYKEPPKITKRGHGWFKMRSRWFKRKHGRFEGIFDKVPTREVS